MTIYKVTVEEAVLLKSGMGVLPKGVIADPYTLACGRNVEFLSRVSRDTKLKKEYGVNWTSQGIHTVKPFDQATLDDLILIAREQHRIPILIEVIG